MTHYRIIEHPGRYVRAIYIPQVRTRWMPWWRTINPGVTYVSLYEAQRACAYHRRRKVDPSVTIHELDSETLALPNATR